LCVMKRYRCQAFQTGYCCGRFGRNIDLAVSSIDEHRPDSTP
jgi:hypothetical protein